MAGIRSRKHDSCLDRESWEPYRPDSTSVIPQATASSGSTMFSALVSSFKVIVPWMLNSRRGAGGPYRAKARGLDAVMPNT